MKGRRAVAAEQHARDAEAALVIVRKIAADEAGYVSRTAIDVRPDLTEDEVKLLGGVRDWSTPLDGIPSVE